MPLFVHFISDSQSMFKPLLAVAAALSLGGLLLFAFNQSETASAERSGNPVATDLDTSRLVRIEISGAERDLALVLHEGGWVDEKSKYPAQVEAISQLLLTLTTTVVGDRVTDNPERHGRFQVLAPPKASAERDSEKHADSLRLLDASGTPLLALLAGKNRDQGQGQYIRFADSAEVYLVPELLSLSADPADWLETELLNLEEELFREVRLTKSSGDTLRFQRADAGAGWQLEGAERPLKQSKVETTLHRIKSLSFEQLLETDDSDGQSSLSQVTRVEADLADQRKVVIELGETEIPGGEHAFRLHLTAEGSDNASLQNSVRTLQERIKGRVFSLRTWQARDLLTSRDDFYESE